MIKTFNETIELIKSGKILHIAGSEKLLSKLPKGNWVGGTTPYFMSDDGGVQSEDLLFINVFDNIIASKIIVYDEESIKNVAIDAYDNGFAILLIPFGSKILETYSKIAPQIEQIFMKNIAGWVTGFNLSSKSGESAKIFSGSNQSMYEDKAVALNIQVPDDKLISIGIMNIFEQDEKSPTIRFLNDSFEVFECLINGNKVNFFEYIKENNINTELPIISNYYGAKINISFKEVNEKGVKFYAPVFKNREYKFAKISGDYVDEFEKIILKNQNVNPIFSCNCILNYLYGKLEGKKISNFPGPITFGEIAYQLVNQTLVYIDIR